jgi:hypothetical protein
MNYIRNVSRLLTLIGAWCGAASHRTEGFMSVFTKISIGGKLRLAFGSMLLALAIVGGFGLYQATRLDAIALSLAHNGLPGVRALGGVFNAVTRFRQLQGAEMIAPEAAMKAVIAQKRSDTLKEFQAAWQDYEPLVDAGDERRLADSVQAEWKAYQALDARLQAVVLSGDKDAAARLYSVELQDSTPRYVPF